MASIAEIRAKYPQYNDLSDGQLADAMHRKFYADMPREEFNAKIGLTQINPRERAMEVLARRQAGLETEMPSEAAMRSPLLNNDMGGLGTAAASMPEGVPIVGPLLDKAAMAASAGIGSMISGDPYSQVRDEMQGMVDYSRDERPNARLAGNVAGAVATLGPLGGTKTGGYALGVRGGSALGRTLRSALSGGAISGADSAARGGDTADIMQGAGIGTAIGGAVPVVGSAISKGLSKVAGSFNKKPPAAPALDLVTKAKDASYDAAERAGVIIKPQGVQSILGKVQQDLANFGYHPDLQPGVKAVVSELSRISNGNVTLKGLDTVRKMAGNAYIQGNKSNNALVSKIIQRIDEMLDAQNPAFMAGINTPQGIRSLQMARKFAHRAFKMETAENLVKKGNQQADRNITDTRVKSVKSQLAKINDPFGSWGRGFTAAEKAAAAKAARYTPAQRALHGASVINPFGGGKLSAAGHIAAGAANLATGNVPGLALQGLGMGLGAGFQKAGEALANKTVREFVDIVARGGVPAPVIKNAMQLMIESKRAAIQNALFSAGVALPQ
jgi:hypothetical protein